MVQFVFLHPEFETEEVLTARWELLKQVKAEIKQEIKTPLHRIPREECNPNMAVVITAQFLGTQHGPTKTALGQMCHFEKDDGKRGIADKYRRIHIREWVFVYYQKNFWIC